MSEAEAMGLFSWFRSSGSKEEPLSWRDIENDEACRRAVTWIWAAHTGSAARLSMEFAVASDSHKQRIEQEALRALRQAEPRLTRRAALDGLASRKPSPMVRELAAWYLGELGLRTGSEDVVLPLIDAALHDPSGDVQGRASESLRKCAAFAIDPVLHEARKGGYERRRLFYVLGEVGDQRAVTVFQELLEREPSLKVWIEDELAKVIQRRDTAAPKGEAE